MYRWRYLDITTHQTSDCFKLQRVATAALSTWSQVFKTFFSITPKNAQCFDNYHATIFAYIGKIEYWTAVLYLQVTYTSLSLDCYVFVLLLEIWVLSSTE